MYYLLFYVLILIIPLFAQWYIKHNYSKYSEVKIKKGLSGFEVARKILDANGLEKMDIVSTPGTLTDHYDPSRKVVRLSKDNFDGDSVSAVSVAAHECGHAIQDKEGYLLMRIRSLLVPVVNLGTKLSYIFILIGVIFESAYEATKMNPFIIIGICLVSLGFLFQIVTLPVEINASKRADKILNSLGIVDSDELDGTKKVLTAAALTYVAGVLTALLEVLRYIAVFSKRN